ncbi:MAG: hypothetical protein JSV00_02790 [bacterium]|nr:MAG: hypothetical protein JSV00_02790 [bacterium]
MTERTLPIAYCPLNDVEAYEYPFFVKKGIGIEPDQLLLEIHLWHMTGQERDAMGELIPIHDRSQLEDLGFARDDRGVYIIGEEERWLTGPEGQY